MATSIVAAVRQAAATATARRHEGLIAGGLLCGWLGATLTLAAGGALDDFAAFPPRVTPMVLAGNIAAIVLVGSGVGRRLALGTPLAWLIRFQVFRVGAELCLALLFHAGVIPVQMTFEGRNWDVLVGLSAPPVAWLAARGRLSRGWLLAWNVAGLALLLNIVVISILSMPTPLRAFPDGPTNTVIATAPYVWLPAFLVPAALGGHLLALRFEKCWPSGYHAPPPGARPPWLASWAPRYDHSASRRRRSGRACAGRPGAHRYHRRPPQRRRQVVTLSPRTAGCVAPAVPTRPRRRARGRRSWRAARGRATRPAPLRRAQAPPMP